MKRKQWRSLGILCLVVCLCLGLFSGCNKPAVDPTDNTDGTTTAPTTETGNTEKTAEYTVQVTTDSGAVLEGIGIYIYEDASCQELVWFERLDGEGKAVFTAPEAEGYAAVLENVPQGYQVAESYVLTGTQTEIVLETQLLSEEDLGSLSFSLGDVICDFSVTDTTGKTHKLSELLEEKEAVMLNFWYTTCSPCRAEFPFLQEAYEEYSDKVEVLALNPVDQDEEEIRKFAQELGLTFPVASCSADWVKALTLVGYPTTVIIDRYGVVSLFHTGALSAKENFTDIFNCFLGDDYQQTVVENVQQILVTEPEEEPINNPTEVSGVTSFQLTVRAGETVYCDVYRASNMYLQVRADNVSILYKGDTYKSKNGAAGVVINTPDTRTPVQIGLKNHGTETTTYTLTLSALAGSLNNPYTLKLGEFNTSVYAGNQEGVYYRYTAQEDGYLTIRCTAVTAGVPYDYVLYNLSTYANRTLEADGEVDDQGQFLKIKVSKGDVVQFSAATLPDDRGSYPAADFTFVAAMADPSEEDEEDGAQKIVYALTVTDEKRNRIPGVQVSITGTDVQETVTTGEKGVAAVKLVPGEYKAVIRLPAGYKAKTTEFILTEANPLVSVKLDTVVDTTTTYSVKVVDAEGKALAGVQVVVGGKSAATGDNGIAEFRLEKGEYTAVVSVPQGYKADSLSHAFAKDAKELTVTLTKDTGSGGTTPAPENTAEYSVTVTDYSGQPMKNVSVVFYKGADVAGIAATDAAGVAKATLPKGEYTAALSFTGTTEYVYDAAALKLTEAAPAVTVKAAAKLNTSSENSAVIGDGSNAYYVSTGATGITGMQSNVVNYFLFKPTESGFYKITTTDPGAVTSYWGANLHYMIDQTNSSLIGYANNAYTLEIRAETMGDSVAWIVGITGAENATLVITRTGDIQLTDEEKAEWIIFEGKDTPAAGTVYKPTESGTLTYIDLTGDTAANTPVLGDDGFYHLGSKTGPILYVALGPTGFRYQMNFYNMMGNEQAGGTRFDGIFYEGETFIKKESYNDCLKAYTLAVDAQGLGIYPLNDDLIYMIQNGGRQKGWWDAESPNYLFAEVEGLNPEIAWMCNVCYFE